MEAVCDPSFCPVTAMEAVCDSSSYPVTATEADLEHLSRSELAEKSISGLSPCSETAMMSDFELSVLPFSVKESKPELSVLNLETINAPHICPVNPVSAKEIINEQSVCPLPVNELDLVTETGQMDEYELAVYPASVTEMSTNSASVNTTIRCWTVC